MMLDLKSSTLSTPFARDVVAGLSQPRKVIPARYFYDRRGSELFEEITRLPEYYPTRTEIELLERHGGDIARLTGKRRVVVEFGSTDGHLDAAADDA